MAWIPRLKSLHGRRLVKKSSSSSRDSSSSTTTNTNTTSTTTTPNKSRRGGNDTLMAMTLHRASSTVAWTAYVWRLMVTMLAPSTALLPFGAWAAVSVWGGSPMGEADMLLHHHHVGNPVVVPDYHHPPPSPSAPQQNQQNQQQLDDSYLRNGHDDNDTYRSHIYTTETDYHHNSNQNIDDNTNTNTNNHNHKYHHNTNDFYCFNSGANLPNVTIYATGGTIAGSASSADQTTGYQAGALGIQALLDAVPQICNVCNVRGVQVANTDSTDMDSLTLLALARQIQDDLDGPYVQGAVITHGTDTLDESAFFLDLTLDTDKPVVLTGSMRPATAISADGPMNLLAAVTLAGHPDARRRGVMVTLNDRIGSARYTNKVNANALDAFQGGDQGALGVFVNIQPVFFFPPSRPLGHRHFDVLRRRRDTEVFSPSSSVSSLPQVDILYAHQELNVGLFRAALDLGAKGIVLAGLGAGYWTSAGCEEIRRALGDSDVPVVVSRRTAGGFVASSEAGIGAGFLNPQRARIQLQLALETGMGTDDIRELFEHTGVR